MTVRKKMPNSQFARGWCVAWVVRAGHIYFILGTLSTSINIAIKRMTGLHPLREIFHISGWIRLIGSCMELLNWYWCWLFIWSCVIWNNWNSEPITIVLMVAPWQALHSRCSVVEKPFGDLIRETMDLSAISPHYMHIMIIIIFNLILVPLTVACYMFFFSSWLKSS